MSKRSLTTTDDEGNSASSSSSFKRARTSDGKDKPGADYGILEYVELTQFMYHQSLQLTLGPGINLITGPNGSGKSAVLAAITIALGGATASTDRGSDLQSFIRDGQNVAEVTVHIKNQGDIAYKPREYGRTIVITRQIPKDGSPTWKIKDVSGNIVSTERDELTAICDHMNIQVDNPLNILTQNAAQRFLGVLDPREMYKLFSEGSGLQQLSDEYDYSLQELNRSKKLLLEMKDTQRDLMTQVRLTTARFQAAAKAREQMTKADALKKELIWAHVESKEEEVALQVTQVSRLKTRISRIQECIKGIDEEVEVATTAIVAQQTEFESIGGSDELAKDQRRLQAQLVEARCELRAINRAATGTNTNAHPTEVLLRKKVSDLIQQMARIDMQLHAWDDIRKDKERLLEDTVERRVEAQNEKNFYEKKLREEQGKVMAVDNTAKARQIELTSWTTTALKLCERVPNPRKPADVQRHLDSVQNTLTEQEKHLGASIKEAVKEADEARVAYKNTEGEVKRMTASNRAVQESLITKIRNWHEVRRYMSMRCKHVFQCHLSQYGRMGSLRFIHEAATLQLRVQIDHLPPVQKTVAVICLLLSLWESIDCRMRCLDEFHVKMDGLDLQTSMNMLIDADGARIRQYIVITSQDMTDLTLGQSVRVHRMTDSGDRVQPFGGGATSGLMN